MCRAVVKLKHDSDTEPVVSFDAPDFQLGLKMARARVAGDPSLAFGGLLGEVDNTNGSGECTAIVYVSGVATVQVPNYDPDYEVAECENCDRAVECEGCDRCNECCHCDKWYCESHDEYHDDDVDCCSNCDRCDSRCECIRCSNCGDIETDYCSNCELCTNGCCDCVTCDNCGHSYAADSDGYCSDCDNCNDCCECNDDD